MDPHSFSTWCEFFVFVGFWNKSCFPLNAFCLFGRRYWACSLAICCFACDCPVVLALCFEWIPLPSIESSFIFISFISFPFPFYTLSALCLFSPSLLYLLLLCISFPSFPFFPSSSSPLPHLFKFSVCNLVIIFFFITVFLPALISFHH